MLLALSWYWTAGFGFAAGVIVCFILFIIFHRKLDEAQERKSFFRLLIDATSQESSKRFIVITLIFMFLAINIVCVFILCAIIFKLLAIPQETVNLFFEFFTYVAGCDFFIICFGIGASTVTTATSFLATVFGKKADAAIIAAQHKIAENVTVNKEVREQNINTDTVTNEAGEDAGADIPPKPGKGDGKVVVREE